MSNKDRALNSDILLPERMPISHTVFGIEITTLGWICTAAIFAFLIYCSFEKSVIDKSASEIGSFLSGFFAPLAFLWLIIGYYQQGFELNLNTKALNLQAEELRQSVEQQTRQSTILARNEEHSRKQLAILLFGELRKEFSIASKRLVELSLCTQITEREWSLWEEQSGHGDEFVYVRQFINFYKKHSPEETLECLANYVRPGALNAFNQMCCCYITLFEELKIINVNMAEMKSKQEEHEFIINFSRNAAVGNLLATDDNKV